MAILSQSPGPTDRLLGCVLAGPGCVVLEPPRGRLAIREDCEASFLLASGDQMVDPPHDGDQLGIVGFLMRSRLETAAPPAR